MLGFVLCLGGVAGVSMTYTDFNDEPKRVRIRVARFGALAFLKAFEFAAVYSPWRTIYVLETHKDYDWLHRHELAHAAQCDRDGWFTFWPLCLLWFVWPGYDRSPYEIEARGVEEVGGPLIEGYSLNWGNG
jgi:hypothetical protein